MKDSSKRTDQGHLPEAIPLPQWAIELRGPRASALSGKKPRQNMPGQVSPGGGLGGTVDPAGINHPGTILRVFF